MKINKKNGGISAATLALLAALSQPASAQDPNSTLGYNEVPTGVLSEEAAIANALGLPNNFETAAGTNTAQEVAQNTTVTTAPPETKKPKEKPLVYETFKIGEETIKVAEYDDNRTGDIISDLRTKIAAKPALSGFNLDESTITINGLSGPFSKKEVQKQILDNRNKQPNSYVITPKAQETVVVDSTGTKSPELEIPFTPDVQTPAPPQAPLDLKAPVSPPTTTTPTEEIKDYYLVVNAGKEEFGTTFPDNATGMDRRKTLQNMLNGAPANLSQLDIRTENDNFLRNMNGQKTTDIYKAISTEFTKEGESSYVNNNSDINIVFKDMSSEEITQYIASNTNEQGKLNIANIFSRVPVTSPQTTQEATKPSEDIETQKLKEPQLVYDGLSISLNGILGAAQYKIQDNTNTTERIEILRNEVAKLTKGSVLDGVDTNNVTIYSDGKIEKLTLSDLEKRISEINIPDGKEQLTYVFIGYTDADLNHRIGLNQSLNDEMKALNQNPLDSFPIANLQTGMPVQEPAANVRTPTGRFNVYVLPTGTTTSGKSSVYNVATGETARAIIDPDNNYNVKISIGMAGTKNPNQIAIDMLSNAQDANSYEGLAAYFHAEYVRGNINQQSGGLVDLLFEEANLNEVVSNNSCLGESGCNSMTYEEIFEGGAAIGIRSAMRNIVRDNAQLDMDAKGTNFNVDLTMSQMFVSKDGMTEFLAYGPKWVLPVNYLTGTQTGFTKLTTSSNFNEIIDTVRNQCLTNEYNNTLTADAIKLVKCATDTAYAVTKSFGGRK